LVRITVGFLDALAVEKNDMTGGRFGHDDWSAILGGDANFRRLIVAVIRVERNR